MSYADNLTPDLANWMAGFIRELLTQAPPLSQRNTSEWMLELLDEVGSAERGGGPGHGSVSDEGHPDAGPREEV